MWIYAIRDDNHDKNFAAGYLFYYKRARKFYIELPENADPWDTPLILSSFAERKLYSIEPYWSELWVDQRIIPPDRQNIGQVLREYGLKSYDKFRMLIFADGRCAQDDYYIEKIDESELPRNIISRKKTWIKEIMPSDNMLLTVMFNNGIIMRCKMDIILSDDIRYMPVLNDPELFCRVELQPEGRGIQWGENLAIPAHFLYKNGDIRKININDLDSIVKYRTMSMSEVIDELDCSRQYANMLVEARRIKPVSSKKGARLFLKRDIINQDI